MTFNEANVNRETDGKFGEKTGSAPDFGLELPPGPWTPRLGEKLLHIYVDKDDAEQVRHAQLIAATDGNHTLRYADGETVSGVGPDELYEHNGGNSEADIAKFKNFTTVHSAMTTVAYAASDEDVEKMGRIFDEINDGAWGDIRHDANRALNSLREHEVAAAEAAGRSEEDDLLYQLDSAGEDMYMGHVRSHVDALEDPQSPASQRARAIAVMNSAARAVHYREAVGTAPGWTQEAYDHITRPYREVFGPIHPTDEASPESWKRRPLSA